MQRLGTRPGWLRTAASFAMALGMVAAATTPALAATGGSFPAYSAAQVAALGGTLAPWQVQWLESGGASGVPSRAATAASAPAAPSGTTEVTTFTATGFQATDTESGSCWTGSIAAPRADAYRCTVGNAIHDPCFALAGNQQVACPSGDPADHQGTLITLTAALPTTSPAAPSPDHPWYFTLAGGGTCGAMTGTLVSPDHPFGCLIPATVSSAQQSLYCAAPAKSGAAYTAKCAALSKDRAPNGAPRLNADTTYTVAQMWL